MAQHTANGEQQHRVLHRLYPLVEVTPVIRPRLLLAAPIAGMGPILLALLYHRDKDAFQSRLRFQLPGQPEFLRRTKWRTFVDTASFQRRLDKIRRDFSELVTKVGGAGTTELEFPPEASDADIVNHIVTSPISPLLQ